MHTSFGFDAIHGPIRIAESVAPFLADLLGCPEVQRLKRMRMLNFDAPVFQDLSSANRLSHTLGVAALACSLERYSHNHDQFLCWVAAAVLHDSGILPFGHLVEAALASRSPAFSHEKLVLGIVQGTYHATNRYHQILPGASLEAHRVLQKYGLNANDVVRLIEPDGKDTLVNASVDLDNIDSIHRMAYLLGYANAQANLAKLKMHMAVAGDRIVFDPDADPAVHVMAGLRRSIYASLIAHPSAVGYNAILHDAVGFAVSSEMITRETWYVSDLDLIAGLHSRDAREASVAVDAFAASYAYSLIDYVLISVPSEAAGSLAGLAQSIREGAVAAEGSWYVWFEHGKVERQLVIRRPEGAEIKFGGTRASCLFALVDKSRSGRKRTGFMLPKPRIDLRRRILHEASLLLADTPFKAVFPENFEEEYSLDVQRVRGASSLFDE